MIVWLNGTFGAGKTTTARELVPLLPQARLFDPEEVGSLLRQVEGLPPVRDFQEWPPWRHLVVETATQLLDYLGGVLVAVQTVLVEQYWTEIRDGLERAGVPVRHFVLHTDRDTLARRIEGDEAGISAWRLSRLDDYRDAANSWLHREATVVDTTHRTPAEVARRVAARSGFGPGSTSGEVGSG